jgi:hypothetical protein
MVLQRIFELFILKKTSSEIEDEKYNNIMNELWKWFQETHKLRIVKQYDICHSAIFEILARNM